MEIICENKLCARPFKYKYGISHFKREKHHYCSRVCQNTTHGMAGTKRHKIWEGARKRARENNVIFTLSVFDIPEVPVVCPILGIEIKSNEKSSPLDSSPSLDRKIPSLGYVPGNVRIISNRANRIRSDASALELQLIANDSFKLELKNEKI